MFEKYQNNNKTILNIPDQDLLEPCSRREERLENLQL